MPPVDQQALSTVDPPINDHDLPPESVEIPIHDVLLYWFKPTKLLDREPSTIGNANPKSTRINSKPNSHSPRLNLGGPIKPPNGPIPGIANSGFNFNCNRPPQPNLRIFPVNYSVEKKRSGPDPGSPKVSCFGSVLGEREKRVGCWGNLAVVLGFAGVYPAVSGEVEGDGSGSKYFSGEEWKAADSNVPDLHGMKKFSSRRREAVDVDLRDCGHVAALEPLDRECPMRQ